MIVSLQSLALGHKPNLRTICTYFGHFVRLCGRSHLGAGVAAHLRAVRPKYSWKCTFV